MLKLQGVVNRTIEGGFILSACVAQSEIIDFRKIQGSNGYSVKIDGSITNQKHGLGTGGVTISVAACAVDEGIIKRTCSFL